MRAIECRCLDSDIQLRASQHPEFDAWRWNQYWVPLDSVIEFKRDVYRLALTELAKHLQRRKSANPVAPNEQTSQAKQQGLEAPQPSTAQKTMQAPSPAKLKGAAGSDLS